MTEKIETWAIVFPNNRVVADCDFMDEAHAWTVALGWPSDEEIEDAKRKGYRAMLLTIDLDEQTAKPVEVHETEKMNNKANT